MKIIDVFSGVGSFSIAARAHSSLEVIAHVEVDGYKSSILDNHFSIPNFGDVKYFALPERDIPYSIESLEASNEEQSLPSLINSCQAKRQPKRIASLFHDELDCVPSEQYDSEFCSLEDFYTGHFDLPEIISFSVPCKDCSRANLQRKGMDGEQTGLVVEAARIARDLMPKYVLVECTEDFIRSNMGGGYLIEQLADSGYPCIQWQTISAAALGYPQLRHRVLIVAARGDSAIAQCGMNPFAAITSYAEKIQRHSWTWHCITRDKITSDYVSRKMLDVEPKRIQWRSLALNALGDGLIPKIPELLFKSILDAESEPQHNLLPPTGVASSFNSNEHLSRNGSLVCGVYYSNERNSLLDVLPSNPNLNGKLFPTLFAKEGNNNASGASRANKAGGLGGYAGLFRSEFGIVQGGLNKAFATAIMGYPKDWV